MIPALTAWVVRIPMASDRLHYETLRSEWRAGKHPLTMTPRLLPQCCETLAEALLGCRHPVTHSFYSTYTA